MRGSPLLRALLAFVVLAALGWPLWHLTRPVALAVPTEAAPPAAGAKAIILHLTFTHLPGKFVVRHLEKDVWVETAPAAEMEREVVLAYPEAGVDLQFHLEWPDDALAALRVRLTDPAGDVHEKSVWGRGTVDEVLSFP